MKQHENFVTDISLHLDEPSEQRLVCPLLQPGHWVGWGEALWPVAVQVGRVELIKTTNLLESYSIIHPHCHCGRATQWNEVGMQAAPIEVTLWNMSKTITNGIGRWFKCTGQWLWKIWMRMTMATLQMLNTKCTSIRLQSFWSTLLDEKI